jgi:hypothetical protein
VTLRLDLHRATPRAGPVVGAITIENINHNPIRWVEGGRDVAGHVTANRPAPRTC